MGIVDVMEQIENGVAEEIVKRAKAIDIAIGDRPYMGRKLSPDEKAIRYQLMREDPAEWQKLIDEHGLVAAVKYAKDMEQ